MYKNFVKKFIIYLLLLNMLIIFIVNILIDPKLENGFFIHKLNEKTFSRSIISSKLLFDKLKEDRYSLVFGTSRSAKINAEFINDKILNFSLSLYGNPFSIEDFLNKLNDKQIKNINKVYILIDYIAFNDKYINDTLEYNNMLYLLWLQFKNTDIEKILITFNTILDNICKDYDSYIDENGYQVTLKEKKYKYNREELKYYDPASKLKYSAKAFQNLKKLHNFLLKNRIEVIYFTPTFHRDYINKLNIDKFYDFQKKVFNSVGSFYDFTYIESISNCNECFTDINHINLKSTEDVIKNYFNYRKDYYINSSEKLSKYYENVKVRVGK